MQDLRYPTVPKHNHHDSSQVTRWCGKMHCLGFAVHLPLSDARRPSTSSLSPPTLRPAPILLFRTILATSNTHSTLLS